MIRVCMQFVCAVYLMAAVNAYDFDIVVRNESGHRFSIVKDFRVPQSSCSDVQYGLNEMHTDAVLASPVKLHLHLSISDYRAAHDDDRLEFVSDTGHFLIKFSKPTSSNPCPYPILFGINSGQQDSKKIKDASYIIECLYSRASGGYVVTIKNHPQQYTPS